LQTSFYQLTHNSLQNILKENHLNPSGANLLFNWHYKKREMSECKIDLSMDTRKFLSYNFDFKLPTFYKIHESSDKTVKFLFELRDGNKVETVLIPFGDRHSICLSSQVGCAMKCSFCSTGTQGYKRNLDASEIVGQYLMASLWLKENRPNDGRVLNIVFMGQGEPLHNFDAVKDSIEILTSQAGCSISTKKITISTSGYLPGLKRWIDEMPAINLALSFHSPIKIKRDELIPINKNYPLEDVLDYIDQIPLAKKQYIIFEYLLIDNFNDGYIDAIETAKVMKERNIHLNLIPFNPFPGTQYNRPSQERIVGFQKELESQGVSALIRTTKGDDILAACGQLKT